VHHGNKVAIATPPMRADWRGPWPTIGCCSSEVPHQPVLDAPQSGLHRTIVLRHLEAAQAGQAGNSFNPSLVRAPGGALYLYHNDESQHDGVHRWRFDGAETLRELEFLPLAAALAAAPPREGRAFGSDLVWAAEAGALGAEAAPCDAGAFLARLFADAADSA